MSNRTDTALREILQEKGAIKKGKVSAREQRSVASPQQPVPKVEVFTGEELLSMDLPEPRWAVEGIIPEGLSLFAGKPKLGKSWLSLNLAIAIATGGNALGKVQVPQGDVLYLALEDTKRRLFDRIKQLQRSQGASRLDRLHFVRECPRQDKGGLCFILDWLATHEKARLVIIDTWAKFRPFRSARADQYEADYAHSAEVKAIADKHRVALFVLHHCRKMAAGDALEEVSGTLGLTGAADATLVLHRDRGQMDAGLFITGRDVEEQELALRWDEEYTLWSIIGNADDYRIGKERQNVLDVFHTSGRPMKPAEAAPLLDKSLSATKKLLWSMGVDGQLHSLGDGYYSLPHHHGNFPTESNQSPRNRSNSEKPGNAVTESNPVEQEASAVTGYFESEKESNRDENILTPWG